MIDIFSFLLFSSTVFMVAAFVLAFFSPERNTFFQILLSFAGLLVVASSGIGFWYENISMLQAVFLSLVGLGTFITALFAISYLPRYATVYSPRYVNTLIVLFILGMQGVILSFSVISFLLCWELMSFSAYFLIITDKKSDSLRAGLIYFVMTQIGFLSLLSGFALLSGGDVLATWSEVAQSASSLSPILLTTSFFLLLIGFGGKSGLFPLHVWLPEAHPQAPSHVSALLSGTMLAVSVFAFLQALSLFPSLPLWWGGVMIVFSLITAFIGALYSVIETDAKKILAWSSVENMGIMFTALSLLIVTGFTESVRDIILIFILLHAVNHFLFKTGLFLAVGEVVSHLHTRNINDMGGLANKWPAFSVLFLVLSIASAALPPFSTFLGEWMLFQNISILIASLPFAYGLGLLATLIILGVMAGLALFGNIRLFALMFTGRARNEELSHEHTPISLVVLWSLGICAVLLLSLSFLLPFVLQDYLLSVFSVVLIFLGILGLLYLFIQQYTNIRITDTWNCGAPLTPRMQYTASGFAAPIVFFFRSILGFSKSVLVEPVVSSNAWIAKKRLEWSMVPLWSGVYSFVIRAIEYISHIMRRLQSGVVQMYVLWIFIALIASLIFAL